MALITRATRKAGTLRDAEGLLAGRTYDASGRTAYDGTVLGAITDVVRATSSLHPEDKVLFTCSQLSTGKSSTGRIFCGKLEAQRNVYTSGHGLPQLELPYAQKLPTVDDPNPPDLTNAQIEANKVARFNHDAAIQKYWNNCFAFLLTWMIKTYLPLETYAVTLHEQWTNLSATWRLL